MGIQNKEMSTHHLGKTMKQYCVSRNTAMADITYIKREDMLATGNILKS